MSSRSLVSLSIAVLAAVPLAASAQQQGGQIAHQIVRHRRLLQRLLHGADDALQGFLQRLLLPGTEFLTMRPLQPCTTGAGK